jgi:zona occludens toxin
MITLHVGVPGAGKSYNLVKNALLPAMRDKRPLITNVIGIDRSELWDTSFCRLVTESDGLASASFWAAINPGTLVVIDEVYLHWPAAGKLDPVFTEALRMHRHKVDQQARPIDIHLGTQAASDIHRDIRGLIETVYWYKKLGALGLKSRYSYWLYGGLPLNATRFISKHVDRYDKTVFAHYRSTATGNADNTKDARAGQKARTMLLIGAAVVVALCLAAWRLTFFFSGGDMRKPPPSTEPAQGAPVLGSTSTALGVGEMIAADQCQGIIYVDNMRWAVCGQKLVSPSVVIGSLD